MTSIVTPSGETQLPWVAGGFVLAVVVDELGEGDGDGLGLGDDDGDGDGDGDGLGLDDGEGEGAGAGLAVAFCTVTVSETLVTLPAPSVARAAMLWLPLATLVLVQVHDQFRVPEAVCHEPPSTATATEATETLSELVPVTDSEPDTSAPEVGEEMVTAGAEVSLQVLHGLPAAAG